jgi:hypothetical protein
MTTDQATGGYSPDALPAGRDFLLRIPTGRLADCNEII